MKIAPAAITLSFPLRIPYIYSELWVRDNGGLASLPFSLSPMGGRLPGLLRLILYLTFDGQNWRASSLSRMKNDYERRGAIRRRHITFM